MVANRSSAEPQVPEVLSMVQLRLRWGVCIAYLLRRKAKLR